MTCENLDLDKATEEQLNAAKMVHIIDRGLKLYDGDEEGAGRDLERVHTLSKIRKFRFGIRNGHTVNPESLEGLNDNL